MIMIAKNECKETTQPAKKYTPKMVEYQWGSMDITQSNAANVVVHAKWNKHL
jgi:hypothetical protein